MVSSTTRHEMALVKEGIKFPSRNRGSYDFKWVRPPYIL